MRMIDADALNDSMYHEAFETDSELQKWDSGCWIRYKMFENHLDMAPTVDAVPVVRGEWIEHEDEMECPQCGYFWNYCDNDTERFNFCPNCGCDMRGERDGEK